MLSYPVTYSKQKPLWLKSWPDKGTTFSLFPLMLQRLSYSMLRKFHELHITWDARTLAVRFGPHIVRWIFLRDKWVRQCNCGYKNDCCMHAFAAYCIFMDICQEENWLPKTAIQKINTPQFPPTRSSSAASEQLELPSFNTSTFNTKSSQPSTNIFKGSANKLGLVVEADFHHEMGKVGLRFYKVENTIRHLLTLNSLYYIISTIRQRLPDSRKWNTPDQEFLAWVSKFINEIHYKMRNLNMYKLNSADFDRWREKWRTSPGRFINRDTQKCLLPPGQLVPLKQIIELSEQPEDKIMISALFIFPDGKRMPYHEILQQFSCGQKLSLELQEFNKFTPILSYHQLNQFFAKKSPQMPRRLVVSRLPELLEGHLEIVEGKCVQILYQEPKEASLQIDSKNQKFFLQIFCNNHTIPLQINAETKIPATIREHQHIFQITLPKYTETTEKLKNSLLAFSQQNNGIITPDTISIPANTNNAIALKIFWQSISPKIQKHSSETIKHLLNANALNTKTKLSATREDNFIKLNMHWNVGGLELSDNEFKRLTQQNTPIFHSGNSWLEISPEEIKKLQQKFNETDKLLFQSIILTKREAQKKLQTLSQNPDIEIEASCQDFTQEILTTPIPNLPEIPTSIAPILRKYQKTGFEFLADRTQCGVGTILADDMGLGKTIQILCLLEAWKNAYPKKPFSVLVISPATVISVWQEQTKQFCPKLNVRAVIGPAAQRRKLLAKAKQFDILLTHYKLIHSDAAELRKLHFDFIILDEAQAIKNPGTQVTQAIKSLQCTHRLALTGTPLENKTLDLWSIMDFVNPGYLGNLEFFQNQYATQNNLPLLVKKLAPVMLRRRKDAVNIELPPRTVEILSIQMDTPQKEFYQKLLLLARKNTAENGIMNLLANLTRLRQACCDPELLLKKKHPYGSAKLELLRERLTQLTQSGHSVLVFSQFTTMLNIISKALDEDQIPYHTITGKTPLPKRMELVAEFEQSQKPEVFLLSLKAAGTGLTLTKADYVFLYDPWWNPAAENQAIDRVHRIGQTKPVVAYRLMIKGSIEERVLAMIRQKQELFNTVIEGASDSAVISRLTASDLQSLLR